MLCNVYERLPQYKGDPTNAPLGGGKTTDCSAYKPAAACCFLIFLGSNL